MIPQFLFLLKGVASQISLGKGGPLLKNNAGAVQIRNADDSAFARIQAGVPSGADDVVTQGFIAELLAGNATIGVGAIEFTISQVDHGLLPGQPVYNNSGNWTPAQANSEATLARGLVSSVINANSLKVQIAGPLTLTQDEWDEVTGEMGGLTVGATYYTDASTPGALTQTKPALANQILFAQTSLTAYVYPQTSEAPNSIFVRATQVSHGFVVGNPVYPSGSGWAKARANAKSTVGFGIVSNVISTSQFEVTLIGKVTLTTAEWDAIKGGSGGLTANQTYFTSAATAGLLTNTEPLISSPMLVAQSTTVAYVRGILSTGQGSDNTVRKSVTIANNGVTDLATIFGDAPSGLYEIFSEADSLLEARLHWNATSLRVISSDSRVAFGVDTASSLNIYETGGAATIQNKTGSSVTLAVWRRV